MQVTGSKRAPGCANLAKLSGRKKRTKRSPNTAKAGNAATKARRADRKAAVEQRFLEHRAAAEKLKRWHGPRKFCEWLLALAERELDAASDDYRGDSAALRSKVLPMSLWTLTLVAQVWHNRLLKCQDCALAHLDDPGELETKFKKLNERWGVSENFRI